MATYILINGYPGSGKDLFADMITTIANSVSNNNKGYCVYNLSTIEPAKEILKKMGWDGIKTPEMRNALAELKQFMDKYFNTSEEYIIQSIKEKKQHSPMKADVIFFIHIREPEKIKLMRDILQGTFPKDKVITLLIKYFWEDQFLKNKDITNSSDNNIEDMEYDVTIMNPRSKEKERYHGENFTRFSCQAWKFFIKYIGDPDIIINIIDDKTSDHDVDALKGLISYDNGVLIANNSEVYSINKDHAQDINTNKDVINLPPNEELHGTWNSSAYNTYTVGASSTKGS